MADQPFSVLGETFNVFVGKHDDGALAVTIRDIQTNSELNFWGEEVVQLHKALSELIGGQVDWQGDHDPA